MTSQVLTHPLHTTIFTFHEDVPHKVCSSFLFMKMCLAFYSLFIHILTFYEDVFGSLCTSSLFMKMCFTLYAHPRFYVNELPFLRTSSLFMKMCFAFKVSRQQPRSVRPRPWLKIPSLAKWLISLSVWVIIKICKKTISNICICSET